MGIWFLVEMHGDRGRAGGYREAVLRMLEFGGYARTVHERRILDPPLVVTADTGPDVLADLDRCSVGFGGAIETRPAGPLAGFAVAPEMGLATLEYLVEVVPARNAERTRPIHARTAIERQHMTVRLFDSVPGLREVVSPLSIAESIAMRPSAGLRETCVDGRFHVVRIT